MLTALPKPSVLLSSDLNSTHGKKSVFSFKGKSENEKNIQAFDNALSVGYGVRVAWVYLLVLTRNVHFVNQLWT